MDEYSVNGTGEEGKMAAVKGKTWAPVVVRSI